MENYETIFKNHDGFISYKCIHYFYIYDRLFSKDREINKPVTIMEIGVDRGGSLEIWKKYLPEGSIIHGIDINPKCNDIQFSENIHFHLGSASDKDFMNKTFEGIKFDIILDDGSHKSFDIIKAFEAMFPKLKDGGLYIVEDLQTSYWDTYGGGYRKKDSSIEYFKNFIEALNADYCHYNAGSFLGKFAKYFSKNFRAKVREVLKKDAHRKISNGFDYKKHIESITFYTDICAIKKYSASKKEPFKAVITGREDLGEKTCYNNEIDLIKRVREMYGA